MFTCSIFFLYLCHLLSSKYVELCLIVPAGISSKYDLELSAFYNNIPGFLVLPLRHQTFVLFAISE